MSETKGFASLSSGLLARKGQATPAMRRHVADAPLDDDLGWNDFGGDGVAPEPVIAAIAAAPAPPVVTRSSAASDQPAPVATLTMPPRAPGRGRAAFTLRLDPDRHLRLRQACLLEASSAQAIVTRALDAYLDTISDAPAGAR